MAHTRSVAHSVHAELGYLSEWPSSEADEETAETRALVHVTQRFSKCNLNVAPKTI